MAYIQSLLAEPEAAQPVQVQAISNFHQYRLCCRHFSTCTHIACTFCPTQILHDVLQLRMLQAGFMPKVALRNCLTVSHVLPVAVAFDAHHQTWRNHEHCSHLFSNLQRVTVSAADAGPS